MQPTSILSVLISSKEIGAVVFSCRFWISSSSYLNKRNISTGAARISVIETVPRISVIKTSKTLFTFQQNKSFTDCVVLFCDPIICSLYLHYKTPSERSSDLGGCRPSALALLLVLALGEESKFAGLAGDGRGHRVLLGNGNCRLKIPDRE